MQYLSYFLFSLFVFVAGGSAVAESSVEGKQAGQYPPEFRQEYQRECLQTSIEEGLAEPEAKRLCECTMGEFERQYSLNDFKQLTIAAATDEASETALVEVGQFCFEQILYEEQ